MKLINQNLAELLEALKQGLPIACDVEGHWFVEGKLMQLARSCFGTEESRILSLAYALDKEFNRIEKIPIKFEQKISQEEHYKNYFEIGCLIIDMLKKYNSSKAKEWYFLLERKLIALQYRLEKVNGGLDPSAVDLEMLAQLKIMANAWKNKQPIFSDKSLTRQEITLLEETTTYLPFAKLIIADAHLRNIYFEWILKDKNKVMAFVQYPFIHSQLIESALNGRIGRLGGDHLKVAKTTTPSGECHKFLTLIMEGKPVSLLDEDKVVIFKGNYKLSIKEIFSIFKNKLYKVGNLEFLEDGINNWNDHHLGYWDADRQIHHKIDLNQNLWWEQLPVFERLSRKQAARRYGMLMNGVQWVTAARATRGSPTLDYDQTHAFMELAIPQKDGSYIVYDFGKFAYQFPSSFFNSLLTFCLNMHATIAYPDENVYYSQRQHGCYPFLMTREQGIKLMELIKEDIIKSREYNLVFQIESENCAKWLYEKLTAIFGNKVPNLFKMSLMKTEPVGFVGACFNIFRRLRIPESIQFKLLTLVHIPFGAGTGTRIVENGKMVIKALNNHEFWQTSEVYLPAYLIEQMEAGTLQTIRFLSFEKNHFFAKMTPLVENFKTIKRVKTFKGKPLLDNLPFEPFWPTRKKFQPEIFPLLSRFPDEVIPSV